MKKPFRFFVELMQQPVWVPVWVLILAIVHWEVGVDIATIGAELSNPFSKELSDLDSRG